MNEKGHKQRHHKNQEIPESINATEQHEENIMDQQLIPEVNKDIVQANQRENFMRDIIKIYQNKKIL